MVRGSPSVQQHLAQLWASRRASSSASPRHPQLRCHTFTPALPSHSTAAPWLCRTSPRCLWCVCVCVCACVSDVVLSSCYTRVAGAWMGWDVAGGQRLAGTPSLHVRHRSAWVSGHGKGFGILPEPLPVLPASPQPRGHLTALLQPKATAGLLLPAPCPRQAAAWPPRTSCPSNWRFLPP